VRPIAWLGLMLAAPAHVVMMLAVAVAGPLEDARTAEQRGDYTTELALLRPLADQGNAVAQTGFGWMYEHGHGVPQDYAQAVVWSGAPCQPAVLINVEVFKRDAVAVRPLAGPSLQRSGPDGRH
jgi:hypothetical protein